MFAQQSCLIRKTSATRWPCGPAVYHVLAEGESHLKTKGYMCEHGEVVDRWLGSHVVADATNIQCRNQTRKYLVVRQSANRGVQQ